MRGLSVDKARCKYTVWKRDTLRLHRGRGLKMHYRSEQCSRTATVEKWCWQHVRMIEQLGRREMLTQAYQT